MSKLFQIQLEIAGRMGAGLVSAFSSTSAQMQKLGAQSAALRGTLKSLDSAYGSGVLSVNSYNAAQAKLRAQLEQTQLAQSKLKAAQSRYDESTKRTSDVRGKIVDTALMTAPFIAATKTAIGFETAMNGVAKQVQGARDDNMQLTPTYFSMQTSVMNLSRELHMMPDVVANTTAAAARMGVQGEEALNDFVRMSVQMGIAFEGSGDQIAEQMAKIANIRGIKIDTAEGREQIKDLADTVNYLDDQTTAKGPEIIETLQRISGTAAQSTFTNNELAALATTMIDLGKTPEIAATGLNALMNRLATAPRQAKSFQVALEKMNINAKDLQQSYMSDSKSTVFDLLDKIKGYEKADQAEILTGLFGAEYQDDISALAAGMDKLRGNFDLLDDAARKGSMEKEFRAKMQTTQFAIEGVKAEAALTAITLTQTFLPSVQMVAGAFQVGAQHLQTFQHQYPQLTNGIITAGFGLIGFRVAWLAVSFAMGQYTAMSASIRLALASERAALVANKTTLLLSAGATKTVAAAQWAFNAATVAGSYALGTGRLIAHYTVLGIMRGATLGATAVQWSFNAAMTAGSYVLGTGKLIAHYAIMGTVKAVTIGMTASQWALNAAMTANPVGVFIMGLTALIGVGYLVYQNFDAIQAFCTNMWENPTAQVILFATGPIGWLINAGIGLIANWDTVKTWFITLWDDPQTAIDQFCTYMTSRFDNALNWLGDKWEWVKGIFSQPIQANIQAGASATGQAQIYANASGGIYGQGAFLTTFAEKSPEAAIPLDGSARAVSLWHRAGEILGVGGNGGGNVINVSFAPVINGGGPEVMQQVQEQQNKFMEQLQDTLHQNARVSYGV